MLNLKIDINSLEEFYRECNNIEGGDADEVAYIEHNVSADFAGLNRDQIYAAQYSYMDGLQDLKSIEQDIFLGGRKRIYKYDPDDGDDMNFDRYIEGLPCLKKRVPDHGNSNGKFIKLHIAVCENCNVDAANMMIKAYTAMRIIDLLESQGYRLQISVYTDSQYPGKTSEGESIDTLAVEVIIKQFNEPLIKGTILTAISPWFLRFWMFKFWNAKFHMGWGYGSSYRAVKKETTSDIYIQSGEALTEHDAEHTIDRILKLFEKEQYSTTGKYGIINLRIE